MASPPVTFHLSRVHTGKDYVIPVRRLLRIDKWEGEKDEAVK